MYRIIALNPFTYSVQQEIVDERGSWETVGSANTPQAAEQVMRDYIKRADDFRRAVAQGPIYYDNKGKVIRNEH